MKPEEMHEKVCEPKFEALSKGITEVKKISLKTHKALCESNGKPSLISRMEKAEEAIAKGKNQPKTFTKFGIVFKPIESTDIARTVGMLLLVVLVLERFGLLGSIMRLAGK